MKTFNEWLSYNKLLIEIKIKCLDCGEEGSCSNFDYNGGKARCRGCGGPVEKAPAKRADSDKTIAKRQAAANALRPGGYQRRAN